MTSSWRRARRCAYSLSADRARVRIVLALSPSRVPLSPLRVLSRPCLRVCPSPGDRSRVSSSRSFLDPLSLRRASTPAANAHSERDSVCVCVCVCVWESCATIVRARRTSSALGSSSRCRSSAAAPDSRPLASSINTRPSGIYGCIYVHRCCASSEPRMPRWWLLRGVCYT